MPRPTGRRRNVLTHLTAAVVVPGCIALCWWQVTRALSGNTLSWAYVFEWPIFAGYAVFMWWRLIHDPPRAADPPSTPTGAGTTSADGDRPRPTTTADDAATEEEDDELASYNRYLAALHASDRKKRW